MKNREYVPPVIAICTAIIFGAAIGLLVSI